LVLYVTVSEAKNLIDEKPVTSLSILDELYSLVLEKYYCE